ncbi:MAG: 30S ribosomal protein S4 [Deltaproteobacteria bacterium]|nr:30S ribosomal protein S4 [Deltaproteobacteria bacterium]
MSRYRGPRVKKMRALGLDLPGLSRKSIERRPQPPGQHGANRRGKLSDYARQLREKQKLRLNYGLSERQFTRLMEAAKRSKMPSGRKLGELLERRLDNVVFRAGFAPTVPAARQLVNHGHFKVNGRKVDIASFSVSAGDEIEVRNRSKNVECITESLNAPGLMKPEWLDVDTNKKTAVVNTLPDWESVPFPVDFQLVVEFYSKRL